MKIERIRTAYVDVPIDPPILMVGMPPFTSVYFILVWVDTDAGIAGESYLWTFSKPHLFVYKAMVHCLEEAIEGVDPRDVQSVNQKLWGQVRGLGTKGVAVNGLSLIDWACWDILGKSLNASVSRMLGRIRDKVPTYAGGGMWWGASREELCAEARSYSEMGFRSMKMRIGMCSIEEDEDRVRAVREAVGPEIQLMVDATQMLTEHQALRLGRRLEKFDLTWIEDPLPCTDLDGHARLAKALDTPIATGEHEYGRHGFQALIEQGRPDILLVDLARVGGVREFMAVADMASARAIPVLNHTASEHSLQLCGAIQNCVYGDHLTWAEPLFNEKMELDNGELIIPDRPGFGFTFAEDVIERFGID